MSVDASFEFAKDPKPVSPRWAVFNLFLVSVLILFLELACIRWFPAHVVFLTFFTNVVLLACFLGMSLGCLAAGHRRSYLIWTPILLLVGMGTAFGTEELRTYGLPPELHKLLKHIPGLEKTDKLGFDVGNQDAPQVVYFGTEYYVGDSDSFIIPIQAIAGFFFVVIALAMVGPGQVLGRAFNHVPNRVVAYSVNIFGSIVGIVLFALCSYNRLPPFWWFLLPVLALGYFLTQRRFLVWVLAGMLPMAVLWVASLTTGSYALEKPLYAEHLWSPYYRIDFEHKAMSGPPNYIIVNLTGHQAMRTRESRYEEYAPYTLPYLFNRDAGQKRFENVLVIGAGSGNDVAQALAWGADHVDAVEIDPVIYELGWEYHPDHPYGYKHHHEGPSHNPRVTVHIDDGRNFLRTTDKKYDLIIYALVDSLVLHSSQSNIRLESFLFTDQAFKDIRAHLKEDGLFVSYNYFRQGWVVARLNNGLKEAFESEPLVVPFNYTSRIVPERPYGGFMLLFAGERVAKLRQAFQPQPGQTRFYMLRMDEPPGEGSPNGFQLPVRHAVATLAFAPGTGPAWAGLAGAALSEQIDHFGPAEVVQPQEDLPLATDDWPFLYVRKHMVPDLGLWGMAIMGGLALVLLIPVYLLLPRGRGAGNRVGLNLAMFCLGAGFMLIETKAVVQMALLFGSTWMVNSVVFFAVLVMILGANLFVLVVKPGRLWPYYVGLLIALALNVAIPLNFFLGMSRAVQVVASCTLVFTPVLFAGVIFAVLFSRSAQPDRALGWNIGGAMVGGLAEYTSMLLGFQFVVLVAIAFYALSLLGARRPAPRLEPKPKVLPEPVPEGV